MEIKVKRIHKDAKLPYQQYDGDACFDLYAVEDVTITGNEVKKVRFGIKWEIPFGYEGVIRSRSSSFTKKGLNIYVGTVDQQYRGEILCAVSLIQPHSHTFVKFVSDSDSAGYVDGTWDDVVMTNMNSYTIKKGEAIAQVAFREVPALYMREVEKLSETDRGEKGFGSTDWKPFHPCPDCNAGVCVICGKCHTLHCDSEQLCDE